MVIWTLFVIWVAGSVVREGVETYIASPLANFATDKASIIVKKFEESQKQREKEKQAAKRAQAKRFGKD